MDIQTREVTKEELDGVFTNYQIYKDDAHCEHVRLPGNAGLMPACNVTFSRRLPVDANDHPSFPSQLNDEPNAEICLGETTVKCHALPGAYYHRGREFSLTAACKTHYLLIVTDSVSQPLTDQTSNWRDASAWCQNEIGDDAEFVTLKHDPNSGKMVLYFMIKRTAMRQKVS